MVLLSNCPFCGGLATGYVREENTGDNYAIIECTQCPAQMSKYVYWYTLDGTEEFNELIEFWNERVTSWPKP